MEVLANGETVAETWKYDEIMKRDIGSKQSLTVGPNTKYISLSSRPLSTQSRRPPIVCQGMAVLALQPISYG